MVGERAWILPVSIARRQPAGTAPGGQSPDMAPHTLLMPVTQCRQRPLEQARPSTRGAQHLGRAMGAHYRHTTPEMATRLVAAIQARLSIEPATLSLP